MLETTLAHLSIFSLVAAAFAVVLIVATYGLNVLRQQRLLRLNYALYFIAEPQETSQRISQSDPRQKDSKPREQAASSRETQQAFHWQLPIRQGTADQVVILITPGESPALTKANGATPHEKRTESGETRAS